MGSETEEKATTGVSTQLTTLVPSFDPSKDDLEQYSQKIEMLADIWPSDKLNELATRLILNSTGAAFQKLQLQKSAILTGTKDGIQSIVTILGGQWGKVNLERKYETVEKALFRCSQRSDETNDSYLARTDIYWTELLSKKTSLEEIQAYVVLRGSLLSQEDKKKVILESDAAGKGVLAIDKVNQSVRMLGSGFFQEMVGLKKSKGKVYDATALFSEETDDAEGTAFTMEEPSEEDMLEMLLQEGDEDAAFISDYETAMTEAIQDDPELASALNAYTEARKRLSDRAKNRGFWPLGNSKGRGKGFKGRGKGAFKGARKSLQQRIMESSCRICGKRGHWKAECPDRPRSSGSAAPSTAATMTTVIESTPAETIDEFLPLEFMQLPVASEATLDEEPNPQVASAFTLIFRGKKYYNLGNPSKEDKMSGVGNNRLLGKHDIAELRNECPVRESIRRFPVSKDLPKANQVHLANDEMALFATHGSFGILDTGATKSVIGSALVPELLRSLHPKVRGKVQRCKCNVTFRFGNQGLLDSNHAIVIPIGNLGLKIAVVQGHTPLLLSNTLLRALKSSVDISSSSLHSHMFGKPIKLHLNSRGLFLVDLNELVHSALKLSTAAETFANCDNAKAVSENKQEPIDLSGNPETILPATSMPITCNMPHSQVSEEFPTPQAVQFSFQNPGSQVQFPEQPHEIHEEHTKVNDKQQVGSRNPPNVASVPCANRHNEPCRPIRTCHGTQPDVYSGRQSGRVQEPEFRGEMQPNRDLWQNPCGQNLLGDVPQRAQVDEVVPANLRFIPEVGSSEAPSLCADHGGTGREGRNAPNNDHDGALTTDADVCQGQGSTSRSDLKPSPHRGDDPSPGDATRCRRLVPGFNDSRAQRDDHSTAGTYGPHGKCDDGDSESHPPELNSEQQAFGLKIAGDPDYGLDDSFVTTTNPHSLQRQFDELVIQITKELTHTKHRLHNSKTNIQWPKLQLVEVFCGPTSELTKQMQNMKSRSRRFGLAEGDLSTVEGRNKLFEIVLRQQPEHVWYSPVCGPWSPWSHLNENKSLEQFDKINLQRSQNLYQLALGVVLLRHQFSRGKHLHWEQTRKSMMFRTPLLSELYAITYASNFDMCQVGELKDPVSQMLIQKSMTVRTTSSKLHEQLHGRCCNKQHSHQQLSGTIQVCGQSINRTTMSEAYTRKFARTIAKVLTRINLEKPKGFHQWHAIFCSPW